MEVFLMLFYPFGLGPREQLSFTFKNRVVPWKTFIFHKFLILEKGCLDLLHTKIKMVKNGPSEKINKQFFLRALAVISCEHCVLFSSHCIADGL